jgi:hypothetical protein
MLLSVWVEMWPSRLEVRRLSLANRVNMQGVCPRRKLRDFHVNLDAALSLMECGGAYFLALRVVNVGVGCFLR